MSRRVLNRRAVIINLNLEQLKYFSFAYELRSFALAAQKAHISPQGMAKAMRTIEEKLGVPLFTQSERGERVPTAYADELMKCTKDIQASIDACLMSMEHLRMQDRHIIRLAFSLGTITSLSPDFLEGFSRRHPNIGVECQELSPLACDKAVMDGSVDFAITTTPYDERLVTVELYSHVVCFWVNAADELSDKQLIHVEDLQGKSVAMPGKGFKGPRAVLDACSSKGVTLGHVFNALESHLVYGYAAEGRGLGWCTQFHRDLPLYNQNPDVRCIPSEFTIGVGLSYLPQHSLASHEQDFYRYCVDYFALSSSR